ncbi:outer membrane beta-barrel protein [Falsiporphyromonas endometrii]|uniref:Outer membrane beta-barrel protein n=1 Tax=Falsiporphyromonas endometrii TaxID=1387297 RepID=A0ABV9K6E4_9PORP
MRKFIILFTSLTLLLTFMPKAKSQIKDVSFTVSPTIGYTWWNNNLNLGNNPSWGIRAGFGFGPLIELRGTYERSFNLKSKLQNSDWNFLNNFADNFEDTNVNIDKWGAELKLNLWSGTLFTAYLTAGSGVMHFDFTNLKDSNGKSFKDDQLYGAVGLGGRFGLSQRAFLSFELKDLMFKPNEPKPYLTQGANYNKVLQNWAATASLDFYLGGYKDKGQDEVSKAYRDVFSDGFKGMKFVIEPTLTYWTFDDESSFRNQVFEGGAVGVDFTSLFGIRAFYYQATKEANKPSLNFNKDLRVYGGNLIARLNNSKGVNPYLNLGAGYIDVNSEKYIQRSGMDKAKSGWFLLGGAGLEFAINPYIMIFGNINATLNEQQNELDKITKPSSLKVGMMYQGGLRFNIGSKANGYKVHKKLVDKAVQEQYQTDMDEINEMRSEYNRKIEDLNAQLAQAAARRDTVEVTKLVVKKQHFDQLQNRLDSLETQMDNLRLKRLMTEREGQVGNSIQNISDSISGQKMVYLTKAQFENLVKKVVTSIEQKDNTITTISNLDNTTLSDLDKLLLINAMSRSGQYMYPQQYSLPLPNQDVNTNAGNQNDELLKKIDNVIEKLDKTINIQREQISATKEQLTATEQAAANNNIQAAVNAALNAASQKAALQPTTVSYQPNIAPATDALTASREMNRNSFLKLNRLYAFTGFNFGQAWNWNIGVRSNLQISNTNFDFVPEIYVGLGKKNGYGISTNVIYNFDYPSMKIVPYAGLGLGLFSANHNVNFGPNILLGLSVRSILNGNLYLDYSSHNLFKNNQFSIGYRFVF